MTNVKYGVLALAVLGAAGVSVSAPAAERAEARLAAQVSEARQVIIDGRLWSCAGDKCTAGSQGRSQPIGRECARVAKVVGPVVEYRQGEKVLGAAGIVACNGDREVARAAPSTDAAATAR
jgi:hypothetical protein